MGGASAESRRIAIRVWKVGVEADILEEIRLHRKAGRPLKSPEQQVREIYKGHYPSGSTAPMIQYDDDNVGSTPRSNKPTAPLIVRAS